MTNQQQLDRMISHLESLSRWDFVTRQKLLLEIHALKQRIDDDCPHQKGQ